MHRSFKLHPADSAESKNSHWVHVQILHRESAAWAGVLHAVHTHSVVHAVHTHVIHTHGNALCDDRVLPLKLLHGIFAFLPREHFNVTVFGIPSPRQVRPQYTDITSDRSCSLGRHRLY
jgi:hypothetical protein